MIKGGFILKKLLMILLSLFLLTSCSNHKESKVENGSIEISTSNLQITSSVKSEEYNRLKNDYIEVLKENEKYANEKDELAKELEAINLQKESINTEIDKLKKDYTFFQKDYTLMKERVDYREDSNEKESKIEKNQFTPCLKDIGGLMSLSKEECLAKFGYDYEIISAGAESSQTGYFHKDFGITLLFEEGTDLKDRLSYVECGKNVDVNGAVLGMTLDKIQSIIADSEIYEIKQIEPFDPQYALVCDVGESTIWFGSDKKDGISTALEIRRNWKRESN